MRRIALKSVLLASSLLGIAHAGAEVMPVSHGGLYAGLGIGSDNISFKQNAHVFRPFTFNVYDTTHLAGTGVFGTVFAGYETFVRWLYLAGEVNANLSSVAFKSSNLETLNGNFSNLRYRVRNMYGISVLPGFNISQNTVFYGRLGYANGQFKINSTDISIANLSTRKGGFRYGVGFKQKVSDNLFLRADYSLVNYKRATSFTYDAVGDTTKITSIKPNQQLIEIGAGYLFNI